MNPSTRRAGIVPLLALAACATASAEDYPGNRPIRVLTSQPGSGSDIVARIIGARLPEALGTQAVVDNRGILAPEIAARSAPDGYTVLFYSTPLWVQPLIRKKVPWNAERDFAPVTLAVTAPNILVVHPSLPAKSVGELVALAKAKPGQLNYGSGSAGSSSHLAAELFNAAADVDIERIPFRGVGPALIGMLAGQVQVLFPSASSALPYVKTGKLRALAVGSAEPSALAPGLPTIASAGYPDYEADTPLAVMVPRGTPPEVIDRLQGAIARVLGRPEVRKLVFAQGAEVVASTPQDWGRKLSAEIARWERLIKAKGLQAN